MTLVPLRETGELVDLCTAEEAQRLTSMIKSAAEDLWSLLLEAHDRHAWAALGYSSWRDYATTEFEMSERRSYQLIDQAIVIREIEGATGLNHGSVRVSERAARDVNPNLKGVTSVIKNKITEESTAPEPERIREIVDEVIADERAKVAQRTEDRQAIKDLNEAGTKAGMDLDQASLAERGGWSSSCRDLSKLPDPEVFLDRHRAYLTPRHIAQAEAAYSWLDGFLIELREAQ